MKELTLGPNDVLCKQGDMNLNLYYILEGNIEVYSIFR